MSTEIKEINGRMESHILPGSTTYVDSTLYVTRFFGGKLNGEMLQLSINNADGYSYVQITEEQARELSKVLLTAFDEMDPNN